jgi:hypothetical protein
MPNPFATARAKLRAIFTEGLPGSVTALARLGPVLAQLGAAFRDLVSPLYYVPSFYVARFRAVWVRATEVERWMWGMAMWLAVLAVWNFVWMVSSQDHYAMTWRIDTTIGLLAYPVWAWVTGKFVAEAGDTRANLDASELRVTTMLTKRYQADLDVNVDILRNAGARAERCVIRVGAVPYAFEYYDGEWNFA